MIEIEGYTAIERIGQGGLGDVYPRDPELHGGLVAVKVLRDVSDESVAWHRTRRELTALVALAGHANVIQLIEMLELPEGPALVMEYAPGGSVAELLLRRDAPLSVSEALLIGRQTASALVAAHTQDIVHRDVKPQNLLIDAYGQIKLCDFGIAAIARTAEFQARTSALSMRYASPEDLDDEVHVGPPADVYSLGATLLHLVHGAPPTLKERLAPWQPPTTDDTDLAALDAVIASCLRPDPADRPPAAGVLDELERLDRATDDRSRSLAVDLDASTSRPADLVAGEPCPADVSPPVDPSHPPRPITVDPVEGASVSSSIALDETVVRPGRRPPERPSPSVSSAGRTKRAAGLAAVGAIMIGAVVLAVVLTRSGDDRPADDVTLVARSSGLAALTSIEWPQGDVGECLVQTVESLEPIACDEPHDLQRIAAGDVDDLDEFDDVAEFDAGAIRTVVERICADRRDRLLAAIGVSIDLDAPFTVPTAATWASGDRRYECWVGVPEQRIVGSIVA